MKKIYLALILGILLVGSVVGLTAFNKSVRLDKAQKSALSGIGITSPTISALECDGKVCRACMTDKVVRDCDYDENGICYNYIGAGCIDISQKYCSNFNENGTCTFYKDYTQKGLEDLLEDAIKKRLKLIADATIERNARTTEEKTDTGTITIK
jgi:hypothetical protein